MNSIPSAFRRLPIPCVALAAVFFAPMAPAQGTGNLTWTALEHSFLTWNEAVQGAADHVEGGFDDWRLPTVQELVDATQDGSFGQMTPNINNPGWRFWTSERKGNRAYTVLVASDANGNVIPSLSGEVSLPLLRSSLPAKYVRETTGSPAPGITLSRTTLFTSEGGLSDDLQVVLDTAPTAPVDVTISTSDPTEGLVSTVTQGPGTSVTLTFDAANWNQPQVVTAIGQDDLVFDGDVVYLLVTDPAASADPSYDGLDAVDATATNLDDEDPMVAVTGVSPGGMTAGTSIAATITGSGFLAGAAVGFENGSGPAPSASAVVVVSDTTITCTITASQGGPSGTRVWDVRVTNPDSSSAVLADGFTVTK